MAYNSPFDKSKWEKEEIRQGEESEIKSWMEADEQETAAEAMIQLRMETLMAEKELRLARIKAALKLIALEKEWRWEKGSAPDAASEFLKREFEANKQQ